MSIAFHVKIADTVIAVKAIYESTHHFCRQYLSEESDKVSFAIEITEEDIAFERAKATLQCPDAYLETLALYRKLATELVASDVLLMHGSVVAVDGEGYLFTAKSGTGKSTHTGLWREVFGERAVMINDDKPLLRITGEGVFAYGTPWDGKHHLSTNTAVPLKAICVLERGEHNEITAVTKTEVYPLLLQQIYRPVTAPANAMKHTLELIDLLAEQVAFYRLRCTMEREAALVAYEGMQGGKG